jgi:hypothetical protein
MSQLGDRLRRLAGRDHPSFRDGDSPADRGFANGLVLAAAAADEAHDLALADSADGRGPHAALSLRWAAAQVEPVGMCDVAALLTHWADEAGGSAPPPGP